MTQNLLAFLLYKEKYTIVYFSAGNFKLKVSFEQRSTHHLTDLLGAERPTAAWMLIHVPSCWSNGGQILPIWHAMWGLLDFGGFFGEQDLLMIEERASASA